MSKQTLGPAPGKKVKLADYSPSETGGIERADAEEKTEALRVRLDELQEVLYADKRFAVLVILQGIDTSGKDGTVKSVFREVGPLGCSVVSFGVPSEEERSHDFLWRHHTNMPTRGHITIHNRSHYESVLVERVKKLTPEHVWKQRYEQINQFEAMLAAEKSVIMKFFLHISKEEQRERLQARVDNPKKQWKFRAGDLEERKLWGDYEEAYEDMLERCTTEHAPWHIVPADRKWYRDLAVAEALVERLEELDLQFPPGAPGVVGTVVA